MINCRRALIWRKQNLTKADFKEQKSFSSTRQVIIPLQLGLSEPARRRSLEKPFLVPGARREASEVLGSVPSLPPSQCPPRTPCSVLPPCQAEPFPGQGPRERTHTGDGRWSVGTGEQPTPLLRAASAQKPPRGGGAAGGAGSCKWDLGKASRCCKAWEKPITRFSPGQSVNIQEKFNLFRSWKLKFTSDAIITSVSAMGIMRYRSSLGGGHRPVPPSSRG